MSGDSPAPREWDARTYDRVSTPQLEWALPVIERLAVAPDEVVLDAGCGSGRVTELLAERLPGGRLIAVDGSASMVELARARLGSRARVIHSDLLALELPAEERVDAVFSNATFHWITDHARLFARIRSWLRPGGRLEAQCGGRGNVARFREIMGSVIARPPYAEHVRELAPTRFAGPEETAGLLEAAGFGEIRCWLEPREVRPPEPAAYAEAVCLGAHLEALPAELRSRFIDEVVEAWGPDHVLDYVRLNISARAPSSSGSTLPPR